MKKNKTPIILISILIIIALMYNVLYFAIPFDRTHSNASFWITYGFTMAMIIAIGIVAWISFNRKELKSKVFGISIFKVIIFAGIVQIVFDIVTMSIGNFFTFPVWITILFEILFFGFTVISLIVKTSYKDMVDAIDEQGRIKTSCIDELKIQSQLLIPLSAQKQYSGMIVKLSETFRYCDPVSDNSILDLEHEIFSNLKKLKEYIVSDNDAEAVKTIDIINNQMKERKMRLKNVR